MKGAIPDRGSELFDQALQLILVCAARRAEAVGAEKPVMEVDRKIQQGFKQLGLVACRIQNHRPPAAGCRRTGQPPCKKERGWCQLTEKILEEPCEVGLRSLVAVVTEVRAGDF